MRRIITALLVAGSLATSAVGCSKSSQEQWSEAGKNAGGALESTGRDIEHGARTAAHETQKAFDHERGESDRSK